MSAQGSLSKVDGMGRKTNRVLGEDAWLEEMEACDTRAQRRTVLRAFAANLKTHWKLDAEAALAAKERRALREALNWLRDEAEKRTQTGLGREATAKSLRSSSKEDLKEAHRIAEMMGGRKMKKMSPEQAEASAEIEDRIASKLFSESQKLSNWADELEKLLGEARAAIEGEWPATTDKLREALERVLQAGADLRYDEYGVLEMPLGHLATKWDEAERLGRAALSAAPEPELREGLKRLRIKLDEPFSYKGQKPAVIERVDAIREEIDSLLAAPDLKGQGGEK